MTFLYNPNNRETKKYVYAIRIYQGRIPAPPPRTQSFHTFQILNC